MSRPITQTGRDLIELELSTGTRNGIIVIKPSLVHVIESEAIAATIEAVFALEGGYWWDTSSPEAIRQGIIELVVNGQVPRSASHD